MQGLGVTWMRTTGLMTTFFILVDSSVRWIPDVVNAPVVGPFFKGGICATLAWWVIWPFETLKNQVQVAQAKEMSVWQRMKLLKQAGLKTMFRGIVPGSVRSIVANGASMLVFTTCQDLRDKYKL
jgi:solute carrier family 25 carnitine/acylcarnitine transporter 20/29